MSSIADLKTLTVPELKKALVERNLNVVGKKQDLITRLTEAIEKDNAAKSKPESKPAAPVAKSAVKEAAAPTAKVAAAPAVKKATTEVVSEVAADKTTPVPSKEGEAAESVTQKKATEMTDEEKLKMRAERFGIPNDDAAKEARAKRFGITLPSTSSRSSASIKSNDVPVDEETLKKRAERFGQVTNSKLAQIEEEKKKAARAERFGIPLVSATSAATDAGVKSGGMDVDIETLKRRAERFGQVTNSKLAKLEEDQKKEERAKRFGTGAVAIATAAEDKEKDVAAKKARAERFGIITAA